MTKLSTVTAAFLTATVIATPAFAEGWARGYGETVDDALASALKNAKAAVASRGSGCVEGRTRLRPKEQGLFVVEMMYSHQNGSCGKESKDMAWLKKQADKLVPKL